VIPKSESAKVISSKERQKQGPSSRGTRGFAKKEKAGSLVRLIKKRTMEGAFKAILARIRREES
jgi:hypothetical protein